MRTHRSHNWSDRSVDVILPVHRLLVVSGNREIDDVMTVPRSRPG
jgi:hypothetical protein